MKMTESRYFNIFLMMTLFIFIYFFSIESILIFDLCPLIFAWVIILHLFSRKTNPQDDYLSYFIASALVLNWILVMVGFSISYATAYWFRQGAKWTLIKSSQALAPLILSLLYFRKPKSSWFKRVFDVKNLTFTCLFLLLLELFHMFTSHSLFVPSFLFSYHWKALNISVWIVLLIISLQSFKHHFDGYTTLFLSICFVLGVNYLWEIPYSVIQLSKFFNMTALIRVVAYTFVYGSPNLVVLIFSLKKKLRAKYGLFALMFVAVFSFVIHCFPQPFYPFMFRFQGFWLRVMWAISYALIAFEISRQKEAINIG